MTKDGFGCILLHALESKVDMEQLFKYPLTPVPLSLTLLRLGGGGAFLCITFSKNICTT